MHRSRFPLLIALSLLLTVAAPAGAASHRAPDADVVPGRYIVVYEKAVDAPRAKTDKLEKEHGFKSRLRYGRVVKGFAASMSERKADQLRAEAGVDIVVADRAVHASATVAPGELVPADVRRIGAATTTAAHSASTANVAVIDTGIDLAHPDLNAVAGRNCLGTGAPLDDNGHGTHVAGSIGARNTGAGTVGVAPGTKLFAVKVLDAAGDGTWSSIICGIDWAAATRTDADPANDIAVANLSLGGTGSPVGTCPSTTDPLHRSVCAATAAGVTLVVAAGNDGWDFDYAPAPDVPAVYPEVLTVSAMSDSDGRSGQLGPAPACRAGEADDRYASYSNFAATAGGAAHLIAAPGTCVTSSARGGGQAVMSGTSMAAPHVAGAVALCLGEGTQAGPCAGLAPAQVIAKVRADAATYNQQTTGFGFTGDPLRPVTGASFGYLVNVAAPSAPADTVAPKITGVSPGVGATGVAPSAVVKVQFNEPMDAAATQAATTLTNAASGAVVPVTYSWSGNLLTLKPSASLPQNASFNVRVTTSARDVAGNALATQAAWSFRTVQTLTFKPTDGTIAVGRLASGGFGSLAANDNVFMQVASAGATTEWTARFAGVPRSLKSLSVTLSALASAACTQTVSVLRPATGAWEQLDSRSISSTEVAVTASGSSPSGLVSSTGDVLVRVRCQSVGLSFTHRADQLRLTTTS